MLKPVRAAASPDVPVSYPVPFRFDRSQAPRYRLLNASLETLSAVSFSLMGAGTMPVQAPFALPPNSSTTLIIAGDDLARNTILIVRWRRENGDEYLWRTSF
jgi:hypothetical protein